MPMQGQNATMKEVEHPQAFDLSWSVLADAAWFTAAPEWIDRKVVRGSCDNPITDPMHAALRALHLSPSSS